MRQKQINASKFKMDKLLAVLGVFILIAFLLTIKPIAELVTKAGNEIGIKMPPVPILQNTSAWMGVGALGLGLIVIIGIFTVPLVKLGFLVAGVALAAYGIWSVYKAFTGKPVADVMPQNTPITKK